MHIYFCHYTALFVAFGNPCLFLLFRGGEVIPAQLTVTSNGTSVNPKKIHNHPHMTYFPTLTCTVYVVSSERDTLSVIPACLDYLIHTAHVLRAECVISVSEKHVQ